MLLVSIGAALISTFVPAATPCKGFAAVALLPLKRSRLYCGFASAMIVISLFALGIERFAVLTSVGTVVVCLVTGSILLPVGLATI